MGSMSIFGSYLEKDHKITGEALNVVILDTLIAIIAGIIIIPSCFAYGIQPDAGPSLLFITLPNVFRHMPGGRVWETLFFIFMTFAALSTVIAVFENIIAITMEIWNIERKRAVKTNMVMLMLLSMPAVLGYNLLSGIQPMGAGTTIMDLEDFWYLTTFCRLADWSLSCFVRRKTAGALKISEKKSIPVWALHCRAGFADI